MGNRRGAPVWAPLNCINSHIIKKGSSKELPFLIIFINLRHINVTAKDTALNEYFRLIGIKIECLLNVQISFAVWL